MTSAASSLRAALAGDAECVERAVLSSCANEADAKHYCEIAFKEPLEFDSDIKTIPKATLVVGAGKLERAKFDEELPKWVTTALRGLGYVEDKAASALPACAGTYKFQHDTGKNEKFVHVFPLIKLREPEAGAGDAEEESGEVITGKEKAEWLCIQSNLATFKEMVAVKMGTWLCKKRALGLLKEKDEELARIEEKLQTRVALTPPEQKLFDATDRTQTEEKMAFLRAEMIKMVEEDRLTKKERELALEQMRAKLQELGGEGKAAENIKHRIAQVEGKLNEKSHRVPLKHEDRMRQLWKKTLSLEKLAEKAGPKGRWNTALSASEVKALGEKEEWEAEIHALAQQSRFWFEEDDELTFRVQGAKSMMKGGGGGGSSSKPAASASAPAAKSVAASHPAGSVWQTVASTKAASKSSGAGKAGSGKAKGGAFAGLGGDSDSD